MCKTCCAYFHHKATIRKKYESDFIKPDCDGQLCRYKCKMNYLGWDDKIKTCLDDWETKMVEIDKSYKTACQKYNDVEGQSECKACADRLMDIYRKEHV